MTMNKVDNVSVLRAYSLYTQNGISLRYLCYNKQKTRCYAGEGFEGVHFSLGH